MANALDFSGLIVSAVEAAQRHERDPLRHPHYEAVIADLVGVSRQRESALTLGAIEAIFVERGLPTAHITQILRGL